MKHKLFLIELVLSIMYLLDISMLHYIPISYQELTLVYLGASLELIFDFYLVKFLWRRLKSYISRKP